MPSVNAPKSPQLLGFWMCVALVVGNSIGSGVFLLPAALAPFGLNSLTAWALTACGAIFLAVVFAQLSRAFPKAGGPYVYVQQAFGPFVAFIVAWGYWISVWVGNAAIATGAVSYLTPLMPWIEAKPGASLILTLVFLWVLTLVNWYGIKASGWVQSVTTFLKVLPLLAIAALGLTAVRPATIAAAAGIPLSVSGTTAAATLTLWALLGLESATIPASKVRDPGRTIPRATLLGTVLTALICIVACTTVLLLVPASVLAKSNAPFVDLATQYWGVLAGKWVAAFAAISAIGALNGLGAIARRIAQRHGQEWRLPVDLRARFAASYADLRLVLFKRSGDCAHSDELSKIDGERFYVHDLAVDDGLPGAVPGLCIGIAASAMDGCDARHARTNDCARHSGHVRSGVFLVGNHRRRLRGGCLGRRLAGTGRAPLRRHAFEREKSRMMGWRALIAVALGGVLGCLLRYGLALAFNRYFPSIPPGTLAANFIGCYIIGVALAFFALNPALPIEWRLFLTTGFCGGLTTFSTFSAEVVTLLQSGRPTWALGAVALHLGGSILLTLAGFATVTLIKG